MIEEEEQGFLSHKFNDFGSEPIPNGWSAIDKQLAKDRRRKRPIWWFTSGVLLFLLSGLGVWLSKQPSDLQQIAQVEKPKSESNINSNKSSSTKTNEGSTYSQKVTSEKSGDQNLVKPNGTVASSQSEPSTANSAKTSQNSSSTKALGTGSENGDEDLKSLGLAENGYSKKKGKRVGSSIPFIAQLVPGTQDRANLSRTSESTAKASKRRRNGKAKNVSTSELPSGNLAVNEGVANASEPGTSPKLASNSEETILDPIGMKTPQLILGEPLANNQPSFIPQSDFHSDSQKIKRPSSRPFSFWMGASVAYVQRTISVDQQEALNRIDVGNSFKSGPGFMAQVQGKMVYQLPKVTWLQVLSGLSLGVYQQNTSLQSAGKQPTGFSFQMKDSLNYSVDPNWGNLDENRSQQLFFANLELGIKPLISKIRQSGPFISALVWTRLSEQNSTSSSLGLGFDKAKSSVAIGYKLGYQHLVADKWQVEFFTTALPQNLISTTQGISIRPQFFGIGINRKIW